jgi:broad specificity phosphatase PhoE
MSESAPGTEEPREHRAPADGSPPGKVLVVRHGSTEWSRAMRHTGRTDIPLDPHGENQARALQGKLASWQVTNVFSSPRQRALRTCQLAGFGKDVHVLEDLAEWDYGDYEGLTSEQIHKTNPTWFLWREGCPGGESPAQVAARADRVISLIRPLSGTSVLFAHGHLLRVLAARWLGLGPEAGACFAFDAAHLGVLGYEHQTSVIRLWNEPPT